MLKIVSQKRLRGYLPGNFQPTTLLLIQFNQKTIPSHIIKKCIDDVLELLGSDNKDNNFNLKSTDFSSLVITQEEVLRALIQLVKISIEFCNLLKSEFFIKRLLDKNIKNIFLIKAEEIDSTSSNICKIFEHLILMLNLLTLDNPEYEVNKNKYKNLLNFIKTNAPQGVNTLRFIEAAKVLDIPCRRVMGNVFQFGWGSNSRWLDSSFTDQTSRIASQLVRDKVSCSQILRNAGFPVPKNFRVKSSQQAIEVANKLGYPVVVKASNLDGGLGVYSEIINDYSVARAFEKVMKISNYIMVEEFILGKDYRIQVCNKEIYNILERQGPKVTGDGRHNIKELIDIFNDDRAKKNKHSNIQLPLIIFNEDVEDYLDSLNLNLHDVPEVNKVIKLRAANNVSGGGSIIPALKSAHPDNIDLAKRVAETIRLDIFGIDFLIPDISISWKEVKCGICEINAQPQISGDKHKYIFQKIIRSKGRIPVILSLGKSIDLNLYDRLLKFLIPKNLNLGYATNESAWINRSKILGNCSNINQTTASLMLNTSVNFIFLEIDLIPQVLANLPFDKVDAILIPENISLNLKEHKMLFWLKDFFKFSKNVISFKGEARTISEALELPEESFKNLHVKNFDTFINQIIIEYE